MLHRIINAEVTVAQKPNQGTTGKGDVLSEAEVSFAGLFFCFFFGEAKKKNNLHRASIKQQLCA